MSIDVRLPQIKSTWHIIQAFHVLSIHVCILFNYTLLHRRRKWGRRGRGRGPNILASCRFWSAVIKYASCLFYYLDTEIQ